VVIPPSGTAKWANGCAIFSSFGDFHDSLLQVVTRRLYRTTTAVRPSLFWNPVTAGLCVAPSTPLRARAFPGISAFVNTPQFVATSADFEVASSLPVQSCQRYCCKGICISIFLVTVTGPIIKFPMSTLRFMTLVWIFFGRWAFVHR